MELETRAVYPVELELRRGGRSISGRFPYNRTATVASRGRVRKERFKSFAFSFQVKRFRELQTQLARLVGKTFEEVEDALAEGVELRAGAGEVSAVLDELERRNIDLLVGHSFDRPLASLIRGTLTVNDTADALTFDAALPPEDEQPAYMKEAVLQLRAKLLRGVSPGFQVPPASTVPNAETLTPEPGNPGVMIRDVSQAVLYEMSLVTRPAYAETSVDVRAADAPAVAVVGDDLERLKRRARAWL